MSPVNRAGSASEISPRLSFPGKNFDVFIEAGLARLPRSWFLRPKCRVPDEHSSPGNWDEIFYMK